MPIKYFFLLVSNEESVRIVFQKNFSANAYLLFETVKREAEKILRTTILDLIVLDLRLWPPPQALELVRKIRTNQLTQNLPIIILSPGNELAQEFFKSGANPLNFFWEPFSWPDVMAAVTEVLSLANEETEKEA